MEGVFGREADLFLVEKAGDGGDGVKFGSKAEGGEGRHHAVDAAHVVLYSVQRGGRREIFLDQLMH